MTAPHVTRTLGPIHFEDLDPHRFEDLIRQLIYDFRQWQSIESTGRGGADDGFDVRAYEVQPPEEPILEDEDEQERSPHPMDGNLWMVQCKREKSLGPKTIESIIKDTINADSPPYGYILAAPAHFSKAAHDKFRNALRSLGVMEFYLWGAGELEDMLYQPKNDRILFAFFGISLASRKRLRTTEIRAAVNTKNKLLRILGDTPHYESVLVRDLQDTKYPYEDGYKDFDKNARWKQLSAVEFHPLGLIVSVGRYYAYLDKAKGEWDYTEAVNNIIQHRNDHRGSDADREELDKAVKGFWELLPFSRKVTFVRNALIRFDSIAFIDEKGDTEYHCPHIFVNFHPEHGPFSGSVEYLELNPHNYMPLDGLKRTTIFPETFPAPRFGKIYTDKFIVLDNSTRRTLEHRTDGVSIYDADNRYKYLKPTDIIGVDNGANQNRENQLLKITHRRIATGSELLTLCEYNPPLKQQIENQIARELQPSDKIYVIEAPPVYDWQIEQNRPVV